ncbi:hypothetical protein KAS41_01385 [Candidatus Parcubacteria bacterium]|nr:hypothetical protein [Candidatus Parcubacteria bacterium]
MNKKSKILNLFSAVCLLALNIAPALSAEFNYNNIISDAEINNYSSMTQSEVQNFLDSKGGYLANYVCEDKEGNARAASEIIYTLSQETKLNPQFMLALLQKEQSLITDISPTERQLAAAVGYGCPDGGGCNPRWNSFFKQINSSYLQFRSYLDESHLYPNRYQLGKTYVIPRDNTPVKTVDVVTMENKATAALYTYTPHVYYGNYNFWKLYNDYFESGSHDYLENYQKYPDGSLLRKKGEGGIYLIQNGEKRPFLTKSAFMSRYSLNRVLDVKSDDLEEYEDGNPIKFSNYSLLRSPKGTIYLLVNDIKRGIVSMDVFKKIGFNPEEVIDVEDAELSEFSEGKPITENDVYPTGALLQNRKTGGVFFVIDNTKYPIWSKKIMEANYANKKVIPVSEEELDGYPTGKPLKFRDGELIVSAVSPTVYIISNGFKRPIASGEAFESLGYKWEDIIQVSERVLEIHPIGESVDFIESEDEIELAME